MKRKFALVIALIFTMCMLLSGCDFFQTIENVTGLTLNRYTDTLLGSVAWPNGSSSADFKAFVGGVMQDLNLDSALNSVDIEKSIYDALDALGVDIHSEEDRDQIEQAIRNVLEENGVDISNIDLDLDKWLNVPEEGEATTDEADK